MMGRSSVFQVLRKGSNRIRLLACVISSLQLENGRSGVETNVYTHVYVTVRMEDDSDQRNTAEKKWEEEGKVRQGTELRCQKTDSKTGYQNRKRRVWGKTEEDI